MTWTEVTLGEFAPFSYGKGLPAAKREVGPVPVYGSNGIVGSHNAALLDEPAVIIGRKGSVGEVHLSGGPCWVIDTAFFVKASSNTDLNFLYYLLQTLPIKESSDSAVPGLSRDSAHALRIKVPDMGTQEVVGRILGSLDELIEKNRQISQTLESIAQTLFRSWFVDFDPGRAKMVGEKPAGMDDATAALFPDSMVESELGEIPAGWKLDNLGELCHLTMGQSPPGDAYNLDGDGLPFYQGRTDFGQRFPKTRMYSRLGNRKASPGDVLVSVRAPVGELNQALEECVIGRGVASVVHKSGSQAYSYCLLQSVRKQLEYFNGEGTVFGAINKTDFSAIPLVEPPVELLNRFDEMCSPINDLLRNLHEQSESLESIRDALLPRLISGELEVPESLLVS